MKFNTIAAAAVAVLTLASTSTFAAASASATLTSLTISLGKLKQSGAAPSVTFSTGADVLDTYSVSYDPYTSQYNYTYGGSAFGAGSQTSASGFANGSVSLVGDVNSDDGATVTLGNFATGNQTSPSYSYSWLGLGGYGGSSSFTLGANTFLDISATYSFATAVTGSAATGNYEYAYANAYLSLSGVNGNTSQSSSSSASIASLNQYGALYTPSASASGDLEVSFVGSRTKATTGYFYGYVQSYVSSNVSAVPEPTNIALLLAGLGAIAVVSRRRAGR